MTVYELKLTFPIFYQSLVLKTTNSRYSQILQYKANRIKRLGLHVSIVHALWVVLQLFLLTNDPLSSSAYPMITYTHPVAGNLPIKL